MDTFKDLTSTSQIYLAPEFAYVIFDIVIAFALNFLFTFKVAFLRNKYKIFPPKFTDEDFPSFNRAQRVHQNHLENCLFFVVSIVIGGIRHPILAAAFGLVFVIGRIAYALGYNFKPIYRLPGFFFGILSLFGLLGLAISTGVGLLSF